MIRRAFWIFFSCLLAVFSWTGAAGAVTINGGNYNGANLTPANGDVLNGVFTNVGTFTVPAGAVVYVQTGVALEIHAQNITILGTLDGSGRGSAGGAPVAGATGGNGAGAGGWRPDAVRLTTPELRF